jgi:hypothetical protein
MARGWESKSVESQIESKEDARNVAVLSEEDRERAAQRQSLLLTRTRVMHDLENATHERYREMLRQALAHLDAKLSELP